VEVVVRGKFMVKTAGGEFSAQLTELHDA